MIELSRNAIRRLTDQAIERSGEPEYRTFFYAAIGYLSEEFEVSATLMIQPADGYRVVAPTVITLLREEGYLNEDTAAKWQTALGLS